MESFNLSQVVSLVSEGQPLYHATFQSEATFQKPNQEAIDQTLAGLDQYLSAGDVGNLFQTLPHSAQKILNNFRNNFQEREREERHPIEVQTYITLLQASGFLPLLTRDVQTHYQFLSSLPSSRASEKCLFVGAITYISRQVVTGEWMHNPAVLAAVDFAIAALQAFEVTDLPPDNIFDSTRKHLQSLLPQVTTDGLKADYNGMLRTISTTLRGTPPIIIGSDHLAEQNILGDFLSAYLERPYDQNTLASVFDRKMQENPEFVFPERMDSGDHKITPEAISYFRTWRELNRTFSLLEKPNLETKDQSWETVKEQITIIKDSLRRLYSSYRDSSVSLHLEWMDKFIPHDTSNSEDTPYAALCNFYNGLAAKGLIPLTEELNVDGTIRTKTSIERILASLGAFEILETTPIPT